MIYRCAVCSITQGTQSRELPFGFKPVPYLAVVKDGDAVGYCCADCVAAHDGPGKFEGHRRDRHALATVLVLHTWSLDGSHSDDTMTSDHGESCDRIGRYLLLTDYSGFTTYEEFATAEAADKEFSRLYLAGMGMNESDAIIGDDRGEYYVTFEGKHLGTYPRLMRAKAAIRLEMMRTEYYPDSWHVDERGSVTHLGI